MSTTRKKCSVRLHAQAGVLVSWDSRVLVNSENKIFSLFFSKRDCSKMKSSSLFQNSNTLPRHDERDTLFKERDETPRANIITSLSLSLCSCAQNAPSLDERETLQKRKEREREGKERESFCVPFSFRRERERERERKNFDFEISRFSSICTHSRF